MPDEIEPNALVLPVGDEEPLALPSGPSTTRPETGIPEDVPELVRAAGEPAVRAYREFLDDERLSVNTQRVYGQRIRWFFRQAAGQNITLQSVTAADVAASTESLSQSTANDILSALRGLYRHLVRAGIVADNPFPRDPRGGHEAYRAPVVPRSAAGLGDVEEDAWKAQAIDEIDARMAALTGNITSLTGELRGREFARELLPLAELKQAVRELDNWEEDSDLFQAGLVVLAPAAIATTDPAAVATFTGVPEPLVREYAARLRANGVWLPDGKLAMASDDVDSGVVEVIINVLIAIGDVERRAATDADGSRDGGLYPTGQRESGDESASAEASDAR